MFDELLGRASLKARIAELEDELDRLERRYEAESDRRADAITAKQEAEAAQNRLEDRIAQLEGELERTDDSQEGIEPRRTETLHGNRLAGILDRLESYRTGPEGAFTASVTDPAPLPDSVRSILGSRVSLLDENRPRILYVDDASIITVAMRPPVAPDYEPTWSDRFDVDRDWFLPRGQYTLALVRSDLFAMGTYDSGDRQSVRGFDSDVMGTHSKGGFSQARFERLRDEQIDAHLERCTAAIEERDSDRLYLVGQRPVIDALVDETNLTPVATAAVDATGSPAAALTDAHRSFWTTTLTVL